MPFSYKPLLKLLIDRGMKKEELRHAIKAGPSSFAKLNRDGEYVSLELLDRICTALNAPIEAVIEHIPEPPQKESEPKK